MWTRPILVAHEFPTTDLEPVPSDTAAFLMEPEREAAEGRGVEPEREAAEGAAGRDRDFGLGEVGSLTAVNFCGA